MKDIFKNKFFVGISIVALFLLGFMLSSVSSGRMSPVENIAGIITTPFQGIFSRITGTGGNIFKSLTEYDDILKENEELRKQVAEKENQLNDIERYKAENEQLKTILQIGEQNPDFEFEMAEVVGRVPGGWLNAYTIDKGTSSGIKQGDPVITVDGLVGRVLNAGTTWSNVVTILDRDCAAGALIARTRDVAVVEGDLELGKQGLCKLSYIDNSVNLNRGDIIETSGFKGAFPKGIRIGRIEDIRPESGGIAQMAVIRPAVDFSRVRQVYIIKSFNKE